MASRSQAQLPISRHPLFPAVVALWFAALLGLGSMAVRASLLERAVLALRLDLVIPAAAPPLGFTARMLLALVLTFGGALLGYVLARRLGRAAPVAPVRRQRDTVVTPTAVDLADSDDGEDLARLEAARAEPARRRRTLTAEAELAGSTPPDAAPLPGAVPAAPLAPQEAPRMLSFAELEPLPPLDAPADHGAVAAAAPAPEAPPFVPTGDIIAPPASEPVPPPVERRPVAAPALAPLPLATTAPIDGTAALRLRAAPLDSLGVVELVERFAMALAARRARPEAPAAPAPSAAAEPGRPFDMPAALGAPIASDSATSRPTFAEPAFAAAPPPHQPARPPAFCTVEPGEDLAEDLPDEADVPEDDFSSLLDMKPSIRPTIALAEEGSLGSAQPVVIFPGQSGNAGAPFGVNPVETEQALRAALATLQRMSGAA